MQYEKTHLQSRTSVLKNMKNICYAYILSKIGTYIVIDLFFKMVLHEERHRNYFL